MTRTIATSLGVLIVGFTLLAALFGPTLTNDSFAQDLANRLTPPVWLGGTAAHPFGTDQLGRAYLARLVYGARISLLIGAAAALTSGVIGITLGIIGGYFGGRIDDLVMFVVTCRLSLPLILVALAVVSAVGSSAAQAAGASLWPVLAREILPNIAPHLVVVATLEVALAILLEAVLSFLGLGVPAPLPSWGLMIAEGKDYMFFDPWVIMVPGLALFVLVLGINLLGDGLRDLFGGRRRA